MIAPRIVFTACVRGATGLGITPGAALVAALLRAAHLSRAEVASC